MISQKDLNATRAGVPRKVVEEAKYFVAHGHEVYTVAERIDPVPFESAGAKTIKTFRWPISGLYRRKFYNSRFQSLVRKIKPDLIIGHGDIFEQDIAYIHNCVHLAYEKLNGKKIPKDHEVAIIHEKILTEQKFKRLICNSNMMKKDLCHRFSIPEDKAEVIYPEYNPEKFNLVNSKANRAQMRQNLGLKDEVVIGLITSGNFKKRNVSLLLKALTLLEDKTNLKVIIAGKDKPDAYEEFIRDNNLSNIVTFHPSINEVEKYYHAIDIFVLPALIEEFGRSVLEAMACGKPVIVSSTVGSSEILEGESKEYVLHDLTSQELTQKISSLLKSRDLRESIGSLNIETASNYTSEKQNEKFEKMLTHLGYDF